MNVTTRWVLSASLLLAATVFVIYETRNRKEARQQLLDFRAGAAQAERKEDVRNLFNASGFDRLELIEHNNWWVVRTPLTFGAKNWYLYLDFNQAKLVRLRIRYADSVNIMPRDAPPDIVR